MPLSTCLFWRLLRLAWGLLILRVPVNLCRAAFYGVAPLIWPIETVGGIKILDLRSKTRARSTKTISAALSLIEQNDPLRFARVQREVRLILNDHWRIEPLAPSAYFRGARLCMINVDCLDFRKQPKFIMAVFASLIIYEATHGYIFHKRVPYVRGTKKQIEVICEHQQTLFLLRLGYDLRNVEPSREEDLNSPEYRARFRAAIDKLT